MFALSSTRRVKIFFLYYLKALLLLFTTTTTTRFSLSSQELDTNSALFPHSNSHQLIIEPNPAKLFDHEQHEAQNNQHLDIENKNNPSSTINEGLFNDAADFSSYSDFSGNNDHSNHHDRIDSISSQPASTTHRIDLTEKEFLNQELSEKACGLDRGCQRKDRLNRTYLTYCTRYKLENLLSNEILMSIMHDSSGECERILDEFIQLDTLINQFDGFFRTLLNRYNCHNGYSVKWNCEDCKKAYKDWLCATNLPYYMNGERIKPCISFCERVEQRCPYFHPITKEQYGGQPVFICRDPNIPFVPEITPDIPYSEPTKCYDLCHLSDNLTELITDSLSKYDYDKCPDKGSIAEEVRSDPLYCRLDNQQQQVNTSKVPLDDQHDLNFPDDGSSLDANRTLLEPNERLKPGGHRAPNVVNVHTKKLSELREVLTNYKSQPKTHKFGHHSDHSSIDASNPKLSEIQ